LKESPWTRYRNDRFDVVWQQLSSQAVLNAGNNGGQLKMLSKTFNRILRRSLSHPSTSCKRDYVEDLEESEIINFINGGIEVEILELYPGTEPPKPVEKKE